MTSDLQTDVVVRAWEANLREEGARFGATLVRRDVTFQARTGRDTLEVEQHTLPGLVIIGDDQLQAVQASVAAIPHQIKFTIISTPEVIWFPVAAHRDALRHWHIECIPFAEWLRILLRDEPNLKGTPNAR